MRQVLFSKKAYDDIIKINISILGADHE